MATPDLYPVAISTAAGSSASVMQRFGLSEDGKLVILHTATDDGAGGFLSNLGTISYAGKALNLRVVRNDRTITSYGSDYEGAVGFEASIEASPVDTAPRIGGGYYRVPVGEEMFASSSVSASYRVAPSVPTAKTMTFTPPGITFDLCPYTADAVLPGSVQFTWMGETYTDFEGRIYRGRTDVSPGVDSGTINYASGIALMDDYVVAPGGFTLQSLWTRKGQWTTASLFFSTDTAPLRAGPGGFVLSVVDTQGNTLTANVDAQGFVTGSHMRGRVEASRGGVELQFGDFVLDADLTPADKAEWWYDAADVGAVQAGKIWRPWPVDPTTVRYSAVSYIYLPVDVSLMGIDPAALPADGRVVHARPGGTCVVGVAHGGVAFAPSLSTYDLGAERLSFLQVLNAATGAEIFSGYTADLDAGTATFTDISGYPALIKVIGRTEVYRQIAEVRIDGRVRLTQPVGYAFDAGAVFSTALRQGDRFSRVSRVYDQASWNGTTWYDGLNPANGEATASYNAAGVPIEVANLGAITERWALRMRADGTTFDLIGQHLGQIASGTINSDFSPVNMAAGAPYFTVRAAGWGAGWVPGNVLFVDTVGAEAQIAVVRCTQPSSPVGIDDSAWIVQRGDSARDPGSDFD